MSSLPILLGFALQLPTLSPAVPLGCQLGFLSKPEAMPSHGILVSHPHPISFFLRD